MPPLSLLFSSDEETSRVLIQALQELEFRVEHCTEIFAAVQRLTTRKLEMAVADWNEGLEASFLLKTARELKSNAEAFTIAVVNGSQAEREARQAGTDAVLRKPFTVEQVKYALLTSDTFLARMRAWLPRILADEAEKPRASSNTLSEHAAERKALTPLSRQSGQAAKDVASDPGSILWHYSQKAKKAGMRRANRFLIAAVATTVLTSGYILCDSPHVRSLARNAISNIRLSFLTNRDSSQILANAVLDAPLQSRQLQTLQARDLGMHIRVIPIHRASANILAEADETSEVPLPTTHIAALSPPKIPESLRTTVPAIGPATTQAGSALLDALEPVSLTQELSENLLLQKVQPRYPDQAIRSGLQGSVVLQALIGRDGRIQNLLLVQGSFLLGQSAYQAVKQWRYRPYLLNGRAVQAETFVTVDFSLPTRSANTVPTTR